MNVPGWVKRWWPFGAQNEHETTVDSSVDNIDHNATAAAAEEQTAEDDIARRQGTPADEGGEG